MVMGMAYGMVGPDDARDLAQNIFVEAYKSLSRFRRESSFKTWLTRLSLNQIAKHWRWKRVHQTVPLETRDDSGEKTTWMEIPDGSPGPEAVLENRESYERIAQAIQNLPVEYRETAVLRFSESLSYHEIAEVLGCSLGTVKSRLHNAKVLLIRAIKGEIL